MQFIAAGHEGVDRRGTLNGGDICVVCLSSSTYGSDDAAYALVCICLYFGSVSLLFPVVFMEQAKQGVLGGAEGDRLLFLCFIYPPCFPCAAAWIGPSPGTGVNLLSNMIETRSSPLPWIEISWLRLRGMSMDHTCKGDS